MSRLLRTLSLWLLGSIASFGQYQADASGPPPSEVEPRIVQAMQKNGFKITNNGTPYCEIWFRASRPAGAGASAQGVTLGSIASGALVGIVRFEAAASDRRGETIRPGVYTLRYGIMPANEAHEGVSPQRDFLLLAPAAEDRDPNPTPNFEALVALSRKASGKAHPLVLSIRKAQRDAPGFGPEGDSDWVLETRIGETPIAVILAGTRGR